MIAHRPPVYPKLKPARPLKVRTVTIAVGMLCRDGVVIAADSELSIRNYSKHYESKVSHTEGKDWALVFSYADEPGLYLRAREEIMRKFRDSSHHLPEIAYSISAEVFEEMKYPHKEIELQMLIGVSCFTSEAKLLWFDGKTLHWASEIHRLGTGDASLVQYLCDGLYTPSIAIEDRIKIAAYIVGRAKSYIEGCSGDTTLCVLHDRERPRYKLPEEIGEIEYAMLAREKEGLRTIAGV